jgi:hypothetical protein
MKVSLDECLPRKLKYALPDHDCQTVPEAGFAGKKNGFLLTLAEGHGFDVFLAMDKGIEYEQNLRQEDSHLDSSGEIKSPGRSSGSHARLLRRGSERPIGVCRPDNVKMTLSGLTYSAAFDSLYW